MRERERDKENNYMHYEYNETYTHTHTDKQIFSDGDRLTPIEESRGPHIIFNLIYYMINDLSDMILKK